MTQLNLFRGMGRFFIIWLGQLASLIGSGLTRFALAIWVYQRTGSITQLALLSFFPELVLIVLSPLAGVLVDRWDRRSAMLLGDAGAGLSTLLIALLLLTDQLAPWHIYVLVTVNSGLSILHWTAYSAALTGLVPKHQFGRANGMIQLGQAVGQLISPVLGGVLIIAIQLQGIIIIDMLTFFIAVGTLLLVR